MWFGISTAGLHYCLQRQSEERWRNSSGPKRLKAAWEGGGAKVSRVGWSGAGGGGGSLLLAGRKELGTGLERGVLEELDGRRLTVVGWQGWGGHGAGGR